MSSNYLDVDAVLAEDEKVTVKMNTDAVRLGFLDSSSETDTLRAFSKVDMPLWLARVLRKQEMLQIGLPRYLTSASRVNIVAHARGVNLRALSPYFYEAALLMVGTAAKLKDRELIEMLIKVFSERFLSIFDNAHGSCNEDISDYLERLSTLEEELFYVALDRSKEMARFKRREIDRIEGFSKRRRRG